MKSSEIEIMAELQGYHWYFVGKLKIIEEVLKKFIIKEKNNKILEMGCGTGNILRILNTFGTTLGIDISREALRLCKKVNSRLMLVNAEVEKIPFKDNSFDLVCLFDLLEHIEDEQTIIKNAYKICKKGGKLILTIPAFKFLWSYHDMSLAHLRRYKKEEITMILQNEGFKILKISYFNFFLFPLAFIYRKFSTVYKNNFEKRSEAKSEFFIKIPYFLNKLFLFFFNLEKYFLKFINFPFGVSIICVAER